MTVLSALPLAPERSGATIVEVSFKGNRKDFFTWELDTAPALGIAVIVDADRGEDLGRIHSAGELAVKRNAGVPHGYGGGVPPRRTIRLATLDDVRKASDLRAQDESARRKSMDRVHAHGLAMKLTDAEWQWDRRKLTIYFTAERRVDFRALVRDLAAMFRTRIELKQIGVRDEARRLDGIGRCGRQYCSASWLPELRPVNLGVAKDQRLSLNPSQISGACGRLMCCLRYEHEFYVQSRKRFPKEGRIVLTARGEEKIVANDIFKERVTLRGPDGETRVVPLEALRAELRERSEPELGATDSRGGDGSGDGAGDDDSRTEALATAADEGVDDEAPEPDEPRAVRRRGRRGGRRGRTADGDRGGRQTGD